MTNYNGFKLLATLPHFPERLICEGTATPRQLEIVEEIAQSARNTRQGIVCGLEGVGNIMSVCGGADGENLDPHDVYTIGWLIATLSPLLEGGLDQTEENAQIILKRCGNLQAFSSEAGKYKEGVS